MCFFKKNKIAARIKEDRELIEQNGKYVSSLIVLAQDNEEFVKKLKLLQETLKYLIGSGNEKVKEYDKKIKDALGDLRVMLVKANGQNDMKVDSKIKDIELLISDRNVLLRG